MTVLMILQDGPLDGESQIVEVLPTDPGSVMVFNIPNWQTFAPDGTTVVDLGLQVIYSFVRQGRPPNPGDPDFDTWDTSWVFEFAGEEYVPPPPPITPPVVPGNLVNGQVAMFINGNLAVVFSTLPGAQFVAESLMDVQGAVTPFQTAQVIMQAVSVLQAIGYSTFGIGLGANSGLIVTATTQIGVGMSARTSMPSLTRPILNSMTPGGGSAGDSFSLQGINLDTVISITFTRTLGGSTATQTSFTSQTVTSIQSTVPATLTVLGNYLVTARNASGEVSDGLIFLLVAP